MTGAMYAAIAGLKSHMQKLNVIGNNISNVNTAGYKTAQTTFTEAIYTTVTAGSNGTDQVGGVNPSQIGYGCNVGTIAMDMSTASYNADGNGMHCMIDGDGFFLTGNKSTATVSADGGTTLATVNPKDLELSRVGDFCFDSQGYLVDGRGNVVYGFVTKTTKTDNTIDDANNPQVSTQLVPIRLPMAAGKPDDPTAGPAQGTALYPTAKGDTNDGKNVYPAGSGQPITADNIYIDKATGKITATNKADGSILVVGYLAMGVVSNPNGVTRLQNGYYKAGEGAGQCIAASIGGALAGKPFNNQDPTADKAVEIQSAGNTALLTGGLESSGTDLATEIAEMITTQRGYQANTRIITVTDSMLEELVNMKR
ncbi:flagellar hook-basal body complex protein [uncultured Oscillibacter sp.]|uniref:flagellar hook-basal body complex protein n=1 Tax=uncultured Oscillibacter sp. TaxID=876091 RepID=UPI0025E2B0FC|nr:flagellar hook-basal body complex protein [uncultured Oscillibacter sp.]